MPPSGDHHPMEDSATCEGRRPQTAEEAAAIDGRIDAEEDGRDEVGEDSMITTTTTTAGGWKAASLGSETDFVGEVKDGKPPRIGSGDGEESSSFVRPADHRALEMAAARRAEVERLFSRAQRVDMAFLVDCTSSMEPYVNAVRRQIGSAVDALRDRHRRLTVRLAFVGYRDFCDEQYRLEVLPFTNDVTRFQAFVRSQQATGGGDEPEDVFGGLDATLNLDWDRETDTRILIHVADAPCHGKRFHPANWEYGDDRYSMLDRRGRDRNGHDPLALTRRLKLRRIQYFFNHVRKEWTEKMLVEFNKIGKAVGFAFKEIDLKGTPDS